MVQISHPYMMIAGKTIAWTRRTFVSKMMSLLFNTLSRFVITFLPRVKCLTILWLQSASRVILEPEKICHSFHFQISSVQFSHSVVSDSMRRHGLQPTRLLRPWDSPGKNTGVDCHFLLQGPSSQRYFFPQ